MKYLDPLYGQFEIDEKTLRLFQTSALTRIRDISLSVVPPLSTPSGMITSRFEHSVGVAFLAAKLGQNPEFSDIARDLYLAGLYHDAGSPPFSHASEVFLEDLTGANHEEFVGKVLEEADTQKAIEEYGGNTETIYKLITGKLKPWSDLINGTIDLDNIDNSLRWGMGVGIFQSKFYEPEDLIKAYIKHGDTLGLKLEYRSEVKKWELCRNLVYDVVYSDMNLGPGSVLFRALEFAYEEGDLKLDFFSLTDSQALYVLENKCNPRTQKLINSLRYWDFYTKVVDIDHRGQASETLRAFCENWKERQKAADIIADSLGIEREAVTVFAGKDRGFKKIHLPFVGESSEVEHEPIQKLIWRIRVYLHPKYMDHAEEVDDLVRNIIQL
jgi:hypothetical protein